MDASYAVLAYNYNLPSQITPDVWKNMTFLDNFMH